MGVTSNKETGISLFAIYPFTLLNQNCYYMSGDNSLIFLSACIRSVHNIVQYGRISEEASIRSGTITVMHPAAYPAFIPLALSSNTKHSPGAQPILSAARRKISGAGFPCCTSVPLITSEKYPLMPAISRFDSICSAALLLATAIRTPFSRKKFSISCTPFFIGTYTDHPFWAAYLWSTG